MKPNKKETLALILRASEDIATGRAMFSCNALDHIGLPEDFPARYWHGLFGQSTYTLDNVLSDSGEVAYCFWSYCHANAEQRRQGKQRCLEVRLMMLAWLHEMVRDGQFNSLTASPRMKTNPFSYLKKAPRLRGARLLAFTTKAKPGDRYAFLHNMFSGRTLDSLLSVNGSGYIRLGLSLREAQAEWVEAGDSPAFDGILYRPTK